MKRGTSGLSFIVGVNKAAGHSSHSALGNLKRTLGESRLGHAGTLDPAASGVLVALVGPAARLDRYVSLDAKSYIADIILGRSTATDDADGPTRATFPVPIATLDAAFAKNILAGFEGDLMQRPPVYSALKRDGQKACDAARRGTVIDIEPRPVHVARAELLDVFEVDDEGISRPCWRVAFDVSKGTYIRALARDIGTACGAGAHLRALIRTASGVVSLDECVKETASAEELLAAALDPLRLLGMKAAFVDRELLANISNGAPINTSDLDILCFHSSIGAGADCCSSPWSPSASALEEGEHIALVNSTGLKAIYVQATPQTLRAECVFQTEVYRGFSA